MNIEFMHPRDQLVEIMPELEGIDAWHRIGRRRPLDDLGRTGQSSLPDTMFVEREE